MAPLYYRNAAVAVVCFDIMDEESFQKMKDWVEELRTNVPEGKLVLAIACTKVCVLYSCACISLVVFQRFIDAGFWGGRASVLGVFWPLSCICTYCACFPLPRGLVLFFLSPCSTPLVQHFDK